MPAAGMMCCFGIRGCFEMNEVFPYWGTLIACLKADSGSKPFEGFGRIDDFSYKIKTTSK
jgi:hypothetical protein